MVSICIGMLRIPFEWLEFAFECFKSLSNGSNLNSNASNLFRMAQICIRMLRNPFEWFEFAFECFESLSYVSNLIDFLGIFKNREGRATLRSPIGFCWFEREGTSIGPAVPQTVEKVPFCQKWDGKNRKGTKRGRIPWP